jgi:hypothetical protein
VALANDPVFREAGFEWLKQEKKIYIYFYPKYKKAYWNVKTWDAIVDKLRTHLANSSIVQDVSHYDNGFLVLKLSGFASKDDFNFQPKGDSLIDKATCFAEAAKQACHEVFRN